MSCVEGAWRCRNHRRKIPSPATLLILAVILAFLSPAIAGAATPRPLRITYLSNSVTMAPLWMAKETGAIAKEGLDIEILSMTASVAVPALLAGELDAIQMSAAPVLIAALRGHDLVFVCGLLNTMIWNFYGRPDVVNAEALRGKIVGTAFLVQELMLIEKLADRTVRTTALLPVAFVPLTRTP